MSLGPAGQQPFYDARPYEQGALRVTRKKRVSPGVGGYAKLE